MPSVPSRNAPCPCGSGKKYKRCCGRGAGAASPVSATPPDALQQLVRLYQQGNFQAASHQAEQLLRRQPEDAALLELAGVLALQLGNTELAVARLEKQVRLQPENALAYSNLCMALHTLGRDEEAFAAGQTAIRIDPKLADAWNNLGNIYKSGNHLEGALEHYEKALQLENSDPRVHINAGSVSQLLGDLQGAEKHYQEAIQLAPGFAAAWNNLGAVCQKQLRHDDAEKHFRHALKLDPGNPETLTNLASLHMDTGDNNAARKELEEVTRQHPDHMGAWANLGALYERINDHDMARQCYDKVLLHDPANTTVHCNLGYSLFETGEQQAAIGHFVHALKGDPHSAKALAGLGKAMLRQNDIDEAREYIDKAQRIAPHDLYVRIAAAQLDTDTRNYADAEAAWRAVIDMRPDMGEGYIGLAKLYSETGRNDDARQVFLRGEQAGAGSLAFYRSWGSIEEKNNRLDEAERLAIKALEYDANYAGLALLRAKLARRRGDLEAALALLREVEIDAIRMREIRSACLFELGNILDKLGRYGEAFEAYETANSIKNEYSGKLYNETEDGQRFADLKTFFTRENWARLREIAVDDSNTRPRPVFIVGFPRSGTSLLEQILGSHHAFAAAGELTCIHELAGSKAQELTGSDLSYPDLLLDPDAPLDADRLAAMRDYYLDNIGLLDITDESTRWVTDKMPHNAVHVGLISLLFPESPIIHISRHPFDSCLSAYFANFRASHRYTSSLESTAKHYRHVMEILDHYRTTLDPNYLEIHYEDLVNDQEAVTRRVLEFIGAPWDDACLEHDKSKRIVRTASYEQVTRKVYRTSLHRYRNYAEAVQPLLPILETVLERFGYTVD